MDYKKESNQSDFRFDPLVMSMYRVISCVVGRGCLLWPVHSYLGPDILEYEGKWALGSITMNKATSGDGIPVELFQILKDDAVKVLHTICQKIWKTQQWPWDWKRSVFIPIPKKGSVKECSNYCTIALISHASKVMLKILQARLTVHELWTSRCSIWI